MQVSLAFPGRRGVILDGVLIVPGDLAGPFASVALCHSQPVLGGHRDQSLIYATARALEAKGIASLRFNFRGVGESTGSFSAGAQEHDDVRSAVTLLRRWRSLDKRIGLMGYSFGATMAARAAGREKAVQAMALVAPPMESFPDRNLRTWSKPMLLAAGENDGIAPLERVRRLAEERGVQHYIVPDADHGLQGHEQKVADLVADFFAATLLRL